ncbi:helix-turn-helix domain-containing protein [Acinetobacter tandoii]|nr:helix-turn-helix domain-containing protein [Acinetobacter tandoii]
MDIHQQISQRIRKLRMARGYTLEELATRSDVSRAMISMIERATANPTAVVLDKLANGLGVSLASLFGGVESPASFDPLLRHAEQPVWQDPESGYIRRSLTPQGAKTSAQLVEVLFPAYARITYEVTQRDHAIQQQIWIITGQLQIQLGEQTYQLHQGDCLAICVDRPIIFNNPNTEPCRYVLAIEDGKTP